MGISTDEMGLGKTIQSIAFLGHLQSSGESGPHLVVSPASTLENWKRELNLWLPFANVAVYHGTQKERDALRRKIADGDVDVILTTYSYFQTDSAKQDRAFLRRFEYGCMVLDEGQAIKNSDASRNR
jgi:SWI/SNF-related matrix-associated actin-dependent regulator of chromatin subfamily A containing DEAD/H box 1